MVQAAPEGRGERAGHRGPPALQGLLFLTVFSDSGLIPPNPHSYAFQPPQQASRNIPPRLTARLL